MRLHVYVLEVLREFFLRLCSFATEGGSCTDRFCSGQSRPPHTPGYSVINHLYEYLFLCPDQLQQLYKRSADCTLFGALIHFPD